jgi:hypothetical protein
MADATGGFLLYAECDVRKRMALLKTVRHIYLDDESSVTISTRILDPLAKAALDPLRKLRELQK